MFYVYDSKDQEKRELRCEDPHKGVRMYVCGMTVYDDCHIGHARSMVVFDVLARFLRSQGRSVRFVRNITDIDDKIIEASKKLNITTSDLTNKVLKYFHNDCDYLGCLKPTEEPKATDHLNEMIDLIQRLIQCKSNLLKQETALKRPSLAQKS